MDLHEFSETVGGLATAIGVGVAFVAVYFARMSQWEATAKEAYRNYLQLAIEYADLAEGEITEENTKFTQYRWFVSYFLNACEEILDAKGKDEDWVKCVETEVSYHQDYICNNAEFSSAELPLYSSDLQDAIKRVCRTQMPSRVINQ
jgi:hypothetical protein